MDDGDMARLHHRLCSYGPAKDFPPTPADHRLVLQDFVANDFDRWPAHCKIYPEGLLVRPGLHHHTRNSFSRNGDGQPGAPCPGLSNRLQSRRLHVLVDLAADQYRRRPSVSRSQRHSTYLRLDAERRNRPYARVGACGTRHIVEIGASSSTAGKRPIRRKPARSYR